MKDFRRRLEWIRSEGDRLSKEAQILGVSAMWHARKDGTLELLNKLVKDGLLPHERAAFIQWVQDHGAVTWSAKKHRFVHSNARSWRLRKAAATPWNGNPAAAFSLSARYDRSPRATVLAQENMPEPRATQHLPEKEQIEAYLAAHPAPDLVGPLGLPQAKYRYGTYGRGSMEPDTWRLYVKKKR